ncbi:MAG: hypothetical protein MUO72_00005 [Bacteroidales bacterium]|nr:hypothetical protein [Bacteroidales bacterium]
MKAKSTTISFVIILFICLCTSCDPYDRCEYEVDNRSDSTLTVIYTAFNAPDYFERKKIGPNMKAIFFGYFISGDFANKRDFLSWADSLGIFIDTLPRIEIKKDYLNRNSWDYYIKESKSFYGNSEETYTLIVSNSDLK